MEITTIFIISEIVFFLLSFMIIEKGAIEHIFEEIYTNPKTKKFFQILGDVFYMVGGSVLASVIFAITTQAGVATAVIYYRIAIISIIAIAVGAYLKRD